MGRWGLASTGQWRFAVQYPFAVITWQVAFESALQVAFGGGNSSSSASSTLGGGGNDLASGAPSARSTALAYAASVLSLDGVEITAGAELLCPSSGAIRRFAGGFVAGFGLIAVTYSSCKASGGVLDNVLAVLADSASLDVVTGVGCGFVRGNSSKLLS